MPCGKVAAAAGELDGQAPVVDGTRKGAAGGGREQGVDAVQVLTMDMVHVRPLRRWFSDGKRVHAAVDLPQYSFSGMRPRRGVAV
jgi:hypothetical protein